MQHFDNGVPAGTIHGVEWIKSRHSAGDGNCVQVAALPEERIAVRNSRDPEGPALIYTHGEIAAFIAGAKDGEFDALVE
ncbi:DUF397 domain-containing protein [Streptomyces sp. NPDC090301]|uniref:DUF397 domain-containing protein n=1 Tax=Streptomyces sp. NPDC090301 TaxID=3154975 RepID=UPI00343DF492